MSKKVICLFLLIVILSPLSKADYGYGSEAKLQLELSWLNPDLSSPRSVSINPGGKDGGEWFQIITDNNSCRSVEDGITVCTTLEPVKLNVFPKLVSDKRNAGGDLIISLESYGQLRVTSINGRIQYYLKFKNKEKEVELTPKAYIFTINDK